jgi:lipopolysaccharide export system protein LptA
MKRFIFLLSALLFNAVPGTYAYAEKADSDKVTEINADQMAYDDVKQINTFIGNVILTRGSMLMKAHKVVVTQDPAGYQFATLFAAPNALATFRQKRDGGPNLWMEGQAERIEYDGKLEVVKLFGKAKIRRLEDNKPTDEVEGELISYDSRAEFLTVNNTANGNQSGAGRIKAVIQPRTEQKKGK